MPVVALREMMVAVASLRTEPHSPGESFEQGRLPRAILAHEQRHRRRELKVEALLKQWNIERVHRWLDAILAEHDPRKKRAAVDGGGCVPRPRRHVQVNPARALHALDPRCPPLRCWERLGPVRDLLGDLSIAHLKDEDGLVWVSVTVIEVGLQNPDVSRSGGTPGG